MSAGASDKVEDISTQNKMNYQSNIQVNDNNGYVTVMCLVCYKNKTQHLCPKEVDDGFLYDENRFVTVMWPVCNTIFKKQRQLCKTQNTQLSQSY